MVAAVPNVSSMSVVAASLTKVDSCETTVVYTAIIIIITLLSDSTVMLVKLQ